MAKHLTLVTLVGTLLTAGAAHAQNVEIYLSDMLDNAQNGYCLDIARAQGNQANPEDGLQGHTCYSPGGELGVDQTFDADQFADGILYMPVFDVCVQVSSVDAGTTIDLAACDGSDAQAFTFSGNGTIVPTSATAMCFTLAEDTRTGRSDANQIKVLSLEVCDEGQVAYQSWSVRSSAE